MDKRFTTVELPKPNKWGIWYDGAYLSTYQVCILLNEYVDVKNENEQLKARIEHLERKIQRERTSAMKQHEKWENEIQKENEQLKNQNELLSDELEQCKAVIDNRWSEYLKKKEEQEND